jgi:hypothetical protein
VKRTVSIYGQVLRTYARWAPSLILLAAIVFVPLGLVHAITVHAEIGSLDLEGGLKVFAAAAALLALAATGLIGEVFYTGAVAISLTHPREGKPPSLRETARMVNYGPLIAIDLLYGALIAIGLVALVVPGVLVFVWLGLAAPVVEIEHRGIRAALARSVHLVRGKFLLVALTLIPIEFAGNALTSLATTLVHGLIADELICDWLADVLSNIAFTPFYAVAAVLLTVDRIREKDGEVVALHAKPPADPSRLTPPSP